jgi:AraC-like DNA-binding protein
MIKFETIKQYNEYNQHSTWHSLVSVIDFSKASERVRSKMYMGLYCIAMKSVKCGNLRYGNNYYDYDEGTLVFISPGQVLQNEPEGETYQPAGLCLVFHPDLIKGTSLAKRFPEYSFFSYNANEALHLSERERLIFLDCLEKIKEETKQNLDKHSRQLIVSNLELLLNYCVRFYDRQFVTREVANSGIIERFETLLNDYFLSSDLKQKGLPLVSYFADEMHLSANYFGDLIKRETGKSAQEYIHLKLIDVAKDKIFDTSKSISEVAYELGFQYPQYFTRLFKQKTGFTPNEFRLKKFEC